MMPTEQQIFAVMQCIEDYLAAQEGLSAALKDGHFSIARGKYSLGSELGQQRYPGDMQATGRVDVSPAPDEGAVYDEFKLRPCIWDSNMEGGIKKNTSTPSQDGVADATADSRHRRSQDEQQSNHAMNPLTWFAALPPPPVRQAQHDFMTVLQRAVAAANALQRLQQSAADCREGGLADDEGSSVAC